MTVRTFTVTAAVTGVSGTLPVLGGMITLDATRAPHVTGTVDLPASAAASINPLTRQRLTVTAVDGFGASRSFNLGVRRGQYAIRAGERRFAVSVASDEALLSDYRALAEDREPLARQSSLRNIVNYVLGKAIPGAALSTLTGPSMFAYWDVTNRISNSSFESDDRSMWTRNRFTDAGVSAPGWAGARSLKLTASSTGSTLEPRSGIYAGGFMGSEGSFPVIEGNWYTFSIYVRPDVTREVFASIPFYRGPNLGMRPIGQAELVTAAAGVWTRVVVTRRAPAGARVASPGLVFTDIPVGESVRVDAAMFHDGTVAADFFTGGQADDANYSYYWADSPNLSPSVRVAVNPRPPESLIWDAGVSALDFLAPLVQAAGLRLVCDENRIWTLRAATYTTPGSVSFAYGVNITDGEQITDRDSGSWFDAMVARYRWTDRNGISQEAVDSYALTASPQRVAERTFDGVAYPGAGFAQYAVQRAQGRGRQYTASAITDLTAAAEQAVTVTLDTGATYTGKTESVRFDLNRDEITILTRDA